MKIKFFTLLGVTLTTLLSANLNNLHTFESSFKQNIKNDQNSVIEYVGKISALRDENVALWEYKSPVEKKIYYYDGKLVIIEPELEQAIFAKLDQVPNILKLLKSAQKLRENVYETTFDNIKYKIITNKDKIEQISYTDQLHNKVTIKFYNQKINQKINKQRFIFKIPEHYDILKQN